VIVDAELAERLLSLVEDRPDLVAAQVRAWLQESDD
jgi:flagellar biosynthesis/type III secretory pathway M-ring protein FliF/YscJ